MNAAAVIEEIGPLNDGTIGSRLSIEPTSK